MDVKRHLPGPPCVQCRPESPQLPGRFSQPLFAAFGQGDVAPRRRIGSLMRGCSAVSVKLDSMARLHGWKGRQPGAYTGDPPGGLTTRGTTAGRQPRACGHGPGMHGRIAPTQGRAYPAAHCRIGRAHGGSRIGWTPGRSSTLPWMAWSPQPPRHRSCRTGAVRFLHAARRTAGPDHADIR